MEEFLKKDGCGNAELDTRDAKIDVRSPSGGMPSLISPSQVSEDLMSVSSSERTIVYDTNATNARMDKSTSGELRTPIMPKKRRTSTCPGVIRQPKNNRITIVRRGPLSPYTRLSIRRHAPRRRSSCSSGISTMSSPLEAIRMRPPLFAPTAARVTESPMDVEKVDP